MARGLPSDLFRIDCGVSRSAFENGTLSDSPFRLAPIERNGSGTAQALKLQSPNLHHQPEARTYDI